MAKTVETYYIFIAAPGDIQNEKLIIKECADQYNSLIGIDIGIRVEIKDWTSAYPMYGDRPQSFINEQVFDHCDIVIALFWTKFGSPTGIAESGTEEEILRAIEHSKPLMLYFNNSPIAPSQLNGLEYNKIEAFKSKHAGDGLYKVYNSVDHFKEFFLAHLVAFMKDVKAGKYSLKQTHASIKKDSKNEKESDETGQAYAPFKELEEKIISNFPSYWAKLYGVSDPRSAISKHIIVSVDTKQDVKKLKAKVADWNEQINFYSKKLISTFTDISEIGADELQNDILPHELWTVGSALDSYDKELRLFQKNYREMVSYKIKDTVVAIINASEAYRSKIPAQVKGNQIKKPEHLQFDAILHPSETLLNGVVGKGIRSEILHKLAPEFFSLMTRRSIWALFFLTDEASEFIVDQTKDGQWRTVHNWDYLYERFTYFNHIVFDLMKSNLSKHKISLDPKLKYGYANQFLVDVFKSHSKEIEKHRKFKYV